MASDFSILDFFKEYRHAVLTGTGFGNDLLFAHILGKESLAHAMIELVCARVVQVLALDVELNARADAVRKSFKIGDRCRSALEFLAYLAELRDKLGGFTDGLISLCDLIHRNLKLGRNVRTAVFTEKAVLIGVILKVGIEFNVIVFHSNFLLK